MHHDFTMSADTTVHSTIMLPVYGPLTQKQAYTLSSTHRIGLVYACIKRPLRVTSIYRGRGAAAHACTCLCRPTYSSARPVRTSTPLTSEIRDRLASCPRPSPVTWECWVNESGSCLQRFHVTSATEARFSNTFSTSYFCNHSLLAPSRLGSGRTLVIQQRRLRYVYVHRLALIHHRAQSARPLFYLYVPTI